MISLFQHVDAKLGLVPKKGGTHTPAHVHTSISPLPLNPWPLAATRLSQHGSCGETLACAACQGGSAGSAHPCGHTETQMEQRSHRSPIRRCHLSPLPCGPACLPGGQEVETSVSREKREQFLRLLSDVLMLKSVSECAV